MEETKEMKILAISGGVDSMVLAHHYRNKKNIVLAFVNYNIRNDTYIDQKIVEDFARKYKLKLEKLILNGSYPKENFENWARETRYEFFKRIYQKYKCDELIIAHHKDDFLETCIMQKEKNKSKLFFGIKQKTTLKSMKVNRPFLFKYWKDEIYEVAKKNNILYNDDYTNFDNKYKRNKIRNDYLAKLNKEQKEKILQDFLEVNKKNQKIINEIKSEYSSWSKSKFSCLNFQKYKYGEEIIKTYINKRSESINLNKNIITNIIKFIKSRGNNKKSFLLSNNNYLVKKNDRIYYLNNKV